MQRWSPLTPPKRCCPGPHGLYPGGGGQPHDLGWLQASGETLAVTRIARQDGQMWHTIAGALPAVGTAVHGRLDWERRYQLMRTHTALHVLCGVVWRDYGALVTGGNMEPLQGRMDLNLKRCAVSWSTRSRPR